MTELEVGAGQNGVTPEGVRTTVEPEGRRIPVTLNGQRVEAQPEARKSETRVTREPIGALVMADHCGAERAQSQGESEGLRV